MHSIHRPTIRVSFRVARPARRRASRSASFLCETRTCFTAYIPQRDRTCRRDATQRNARLLSRKTLNHRRPVAIFQSCPSRAALITTRDRGGFVSCASSDNNGNKEVEGVDFNLYHGRGYRAFVIVALGNHSIIFLGRCRDLTNPRGKRKREATTSR